MRIHVLRLGIAMTLAAAALTLLFLSAVGDRSDGELSQARPAADTEQEWVVSTRTGGLQLISTRLAGVSRRRAISDPGILSPLILANNGREVVVTGHFTCTRGDVYEIRTAVTQRSTGALAAGKTQGRCSGRAEPFEAATWVYDEALFVPGPAQACAMMVTQADSQITDVFQWCRKDDAQLTVTRPAY
jgi:hypothetical protein